jgi:hypothetical protein
MTTDHRPAPRIYLSLFAFVCRRKQVEASTSRSSDRCRLGAIAVTGRRKFVLSVSIVKNRESKGAGRTSRETRGNRSPPTVGRATVSGDEILIKRDIDRKRCKVYIGRAMKPRKDTVARASEGSRSKRESGGKIGGM